MAKKKQNIYKNPKKSKYFDDLVNKALRDPKLKNSAKKYQKYAVIEYGEKMTMKQIMDESVFYGTQNSKHGKIKKALMNKKTWDEVKKNIWYEMEKEFRGWP